MSVTVNVSSTSSQNTHHVSLEVDGTKVGLRIKDFPKGFRTYPYSPSSMKFNQGRSGYSSFELPYTSIDQTDWSGGLGQLKFEDPTRFFDAYNMWTLTPGILTTCPRYTWGTGYRDSDGDDDTEISDANYKILSGGNRYRYSQFTASASYDVAYIMVYMKYYGSPGLVTAALYSDDASDKPNTSLKAKTVAASLQEKAGVAQWVEFELPSVQTINSGTKYHVVVSDAANADDTTTDFWELPSDISGTKTGSGYPSNGGITWAPDDSEEITTFMFRLTDANTAVKYHFFEHKRALYAATEPDDGSAGKILLNGDRGVATGTSSSTTLQDTTKSWTTSEWNGTYIYIWKGTGKGQIPRRISGNTTNTLTITPAFDITPVAGAKGTGSEYVILGSLKWTDVTPSGSGAATLSAPVTSVITLWEIIYLAQGDSTNILRVREYNDEGVYKTFWGANAATATYGTNVAVDDGTNKATLLTIAYDPVHDNIIWKAMNKDDNGNTSVSRANDVTWNDGGDGAGTDLTFPTTGVGGYTPCGNPDYKITGILVYNNFLYVGKEDSLWYIENDGKYDRAYPVPIGLSAMASKFNNVAMATQDMFLFLNWSHSLERLFGSTLDDIGPWRDFGLPKYARGYIAGLEPVVGWMFGALDAGANDTSSILVYQNGWHPLFRAWKSNKRIRSVKWQTIDGARNYLWFGCGGDLIRMQMPYNTLNPTQDNALGFCPEGAITTSIYDAGYAELEKYFDGIKVVSSSIDRVGIDYSTNVRLIDGRPTWTDAGNMTTAPSDTVSLAQSRKRNVMLRLRQQKSEGGGKGVIYATVLDAVARTPVKFNWDLRIALDDNAKTLTGAEDHDQDTLIDQLHTWSGQAQAIATRNIDPFADDSGTGRTVMIEPPNILRQGWNKVTRKFFGYATVTLREL